MPLNHLDLFSGFGGFRLAAEWAWPDIETVAFVEKDPFCQDWLRANWPEVPIHDDIKTFKWSDYEREISEATGRDAAVYLLSGGFP